MKLKSLLITVASIACLPSAQAVSLSTDGRGQVLLYAYYTTQGTNDTLFSIGNSTHVGKAVKVRFREGRNSRAVLDFNVYLAADAVWTAMVTKNGSGNPVLRTQSTACTVPKFQPSAASADWKEIAFTNDNFAGYDQGGSGLDRAREGFLEVLEMGEVANFPLRVGMSFEQAITYATGTQDCTLVESAWAAGGAFSTTSGAGLTTPAGGLFGMGTIINVAQGTDYSFDPVALAGVFAAKHHTAPGATVPSLADADPQSRVIANDTVHSSTWDNGIDAVSATLMHQTVINEYISTTSSLAASDVVLTFPTKGFYVVRESDSPQTTRAPFTAPFHNIKVSDGASLGACES